jgi:hypothetical protein
MRDGLIVGDEPVFHQAVDATVERELVAAFG